MARHIAANAVNFLIIILIVLGGIVVWGKNEFTKPGPLTEAIFIEVPRGGNIRGVSENLETQGAISNASVMRLGAEYNKQSSLLKFGNYEIPAGSSMQDILAIITKSGRGSYRFVASYRIRNNGAQMQLRERVPDTNEFLDVVRFDAGEGFPEEYTKLVEAKTPIAYRVTIAEGLTSWQIAEGLKQADFLSGEISEIPAEGSLAPDTYEVRRGATGEEVLELMRDAQNRTIAKAWEDRLEDLPIKTQEDAIILASIIEKETGVNSERELVSSVFINRLNKGMKLQTDPTVIYGITEGKGTLGRGLRRSELSKKTAYNTYIIPGLPPTPIANPGRAAIEAALKPESSEFLFFVADGTGGHAFAKTLAEHNRNVANWRKIEAELRRKEQN